MVLKYIGTKSENTKIHIGDATERWRRLKPEKKLTTDAQVINFLPGR